MLDEEEMMDYNTSQPIINTNNDIFNNIIEGGDKNEIHTPIIGDTEEFNSINKNAVGETLNTATTFDNKMNSVEKRHANKDIFFKKFLEKNTFAKWMMTYIDRYKFIIMFIVIALVITFMEITVASNMSDCSYPLNKNKILKIQPSCLNIGVNDYIYVYNENKFSKDEVIRKAHVPNYYNKIVLNDHITKQLSKPIKNIKNTLSRGFTTPTPISDLSTNIINISRLKDYSNPTISFNVYESSWCVLYPKDVRVNCFCNKNKIYFN